MIRCPNCGQKLDIAELTLTERQRRLRDAIEQIRRDNGRPARTAEIAEAVGYAPSTIKPDLKQLRAIGVICNPNGPKSGWAPRTDKFVLVRAA
jgi:predicted transcriptional regulator